MAVSERLQGNGRRKVEHLNVPGYPHKTVCGKFNSKQSGIPDHLFAVVRNAVFSNTCSCTPLRVAEEEL